MNNKSYTSVFLGKTVLIQANIVQDAQNIVAGKESDTKHLQIICVWQKGADALIEQYRQLKLPKSDKFMPAQIISLAQS